MNYFNLIVKSLELRRFQKFEHWLQGRRFIQIGALCDVIYIFLKSWSRTGEVSYWTPALYPLFFSVATVTVREFLPAGSPVACALLSVPFLNFSRRRAAVHKSWRIRPRLDFILHLAWFCDSESDSCIRDGIQGSYWTIRGPAKPVFLIRSFAPEGTF